MKLHELLEPYYTDNCPHCLRLRSEKKSISSLHIKYSRAILEHRILPDPIVEIDGNIQHVPTERGIFTQEELRELFPAHGIGPWWSLGNYTLFLVAASCGLRRGELLALRWQHLNLQAGELSVVEAWKSRTELGPPKWDHVRERLPIPEITIHRLREYQLQTQCAAPEDLIFPNPSGARLSCRSFHTVFEKAMRRAGINAKTRNLCPHSFRQSLCTLLRDSGIDAAKIQALLGWSGPAMLNVYTHLQPEHLQPAATEINRLLT